MVCVCVQVCDIAIMPDVHCSSSVHNVHYCAVAICSSVHTLELIIMINSILCALLALIFCMQSHILMVLLCALCFVVPVPDYVVYDNNNIMVVRCVAAASDKFLVLRVGVQQHDVPRINFASSCMCMPPCS